MVSLLSEEVRARLNLAPVCHNLYEVARALGFEWRDGEHGLPPDLPRPRLRQPPRLRARPRHGRFKSEGKEGEKGEEAKREDDRHAASHHQVEDERHAASHPPSSPFNLFPLFPLFRGSGRRPSSASSRRRASARRFRSNTLTPRGAPSSNRRQATGRERAQVRGFLGVSGEQLRAFAAHRTRAMQHVEESFAYKNRRVEKEPLDLVAPARSLGRAGRGAAPAARSKTSSCSNTTPLFRSGSSTSRSRRASAPRRAAPSSCAARATRRTTRESSARSSASPTPKAASRRVEDLGLLRLRAGDWMVLNPLADAEGRALPAWRIVRGRLAVVEELTDAGLLLRLCR